MLVTLGRVIEGSKSSGILGIGDRTAIIDYIQRGIELACYKANYDPSVGIIDVCSDACGLVTLPSFIATVMQVNVGGYPTIFRNQWYDFHVNGLGNQCPIQIGFSNDAGWSPVFQDLKEWSVVAAICEDATDGDGSKVMIVEGETMDSLGNIKQAITIPVAGASESGIKIPLLNGYANTDGANPTFFRKITRVTKPVTRGYVKLIAFPMRQMALSVTLGYYDPNETTPNYKRIRVGQSCKWVRLLYRRASLSLVNDWDIVPINSYQAMLDLIKAINMSDSNNPQASELYLAKAVRLMNEVQSIENNASWNPIQVEPGFGIGTLDPR